MAAACLAASAGGATAVPWLFSLAIDAIRLPDAHASRWFYGGLFLGVTAAASALRYRARTLLVAITGQIERTLRNELYAHLASVPVRHHAALRVGDRVARLTREITTACSVLDLFWYATQIAIAAGSLVMMALISPTLLIGAVLPLAIVPVLVHHRERSIRASMNEAGDQHARLTALTEESIVSARAVRAYVAEAREIERFAQANDDHERTHLQIAQAFATLNLIGQVLGGVAAVIVLWLGAAQVMSGTIGFAEFLAFFGYFSLVQSSVLGLGSILNHAERCLAAAARIAEVFAWPAPAPERELELQPDLEAQPEPEPPIAQAPRSPAHTTPAHTTLSTVTEVAKRAQTTQAPAAVELRDLTFSHGDTPLLDRVSLRIASGAIVAIVGPNGSGKSTLAALLLRVLEPPRGTIFLDGLDLCDWRLSSLRRDVALVPEEPHLFDGTIADNVAFGQGGRRSSDAIDAALDVAALRGVLAHLPDGLDSIVGERGTRLSGGQRQRLALARALAIEPRLLVLDGALSAVDASTERAIMASLRRAARTTIVITNRPSVAAAADQVILFENGRIVDRGRHHELTTRNAAYLAAVRQESLEHHVEHVAPVGPID